MNIFRSAIFILALARNLYVVEANLFPFNCVVDGPWIGENAACQSINPDPVTRDYKWWIIKTSTPRCANHLRRTVIAVMRPFMIASAVPATTRMVAVRQ
ncbi:hypothetical protein PSHT_09497 [Puccinia striiformis]|uniref:Secreted protein n=1 Tax=Puccinia striiformis TaxID=27350 RepID=A0A2S4VGD4_9BASI|nr:hypothetical protein PSHT_09497 [Puccinia striiformis]